MPAFELYTDGGSHGNPGPGAWAYVLDGPGGQREEAAAYRHTTNNRMELMAVIRGLSAIRGISDSDALVELYTDSQYVKKGLTEWMAGWIRNGWMTAGRKPVKNRDLWEKLKGVADELQIRWHWVAGHSGIELNERCDQLVGVAIRQGPWQDDNPS